MVSEAQWPWPLELIPETLKNSISTMECMHILFTAVEEN